MNADRYCWNVVFCVILFNCCMYGVGKYVVLEVGVGFIYMLLE